MTIVNPLLLNLRAVKGRAYPRVVGANREPSWIFFETVLPLLGIAAYVLIYESFFRAPGADDTFLNAMIGFVVLGGTMVAFWMNVLWSMASQLYWEKEMGNLQLYMMAPMSRMALLGGMALGGMFMTSTRAFATLFAGVVVFGVHFELANPLMILAVFFATLIALYGMGMMLASLYLLWGREAWHMSSLMEEPIFLISGFYFPIRAFGEVGAWGRAIAFGAAVIPAALGLDALRQLLHPEFFGGQYWLLSVQLELVILVVLCAVFLALARSSLGYLEILAKREGRLTSRHQ